MDAEFGRESIVGDDTTLQVAADVHKKSDKLRGEA